MTPQSEPRQSGSARMCWKGLHPMTPDNVFTRPGDSYERCIACRRIRDAAWRAKNPGTATPRVKKYRSDPEKAERDRERSRRWKRENLGQPGLPKAA